MDPTYVSNDTITSGALSRINDLKVALGIMASVITALAGVIYAMWRHINKREKVSDGRIETFTAVAKEMTTAVAGLHKAIEDLDRTVERTLIDPHLQTKRPRR